MFDAFAALFILTAATVSIMTLIGTIFDWH